MTEEENKGKHRPGTDEAVEAGCICAFSPKDPVVVKFSCPYHYDLPEVADLD